MAAGKTVSRARAAGVAFAILVSSGAAALQVGGGVSAAGCGGAVTGGGKGNVDPAGAPIVLGASIGLTGSLAGNAPAMQNGLLAAAQQVNALGGILGRQVYVSTEDDKSDPNQALTVAKSLFGQGVSSLVGPIGSQQVSNVESFIGMNKLVEVSSTATSAELTSSFSPKSGYFFRTVPSDAYQAVAVALFAMQGPGADGGAAGGDGGSAGCSRMDVVHNNDTYGNPLAASIEAYFKAHGGSVPSDISVPENALNAYDSQVAQVVGDLPGCLVLAVYPQTAATFMQDLASMLMPTPKGWLPGFFVIGTDGTYDPSLITDGLANPADPNSMSFVQGMYGTVALTNDHDRQEYNELVSIYDAEVGLGPGQTDLDPYTSNQYDAAILVLLAMEAAGTTTDGAAIQQAMFNVSRGKQCGAAPYTPAQVGDAITALQGQNDINYQGASGDVDFDDYGDVIANFLVWEVQGTGFVNHTTISSIQLQKAQSMTDAGGCQ